MKVKIAYTVEIEDVPDHIRSLTKKATGFLEEIDLTFEKLRRNLNDSKNGCENAENLKLLTHLRMKLSDMDLSLQDVSEMMLGYQQLQLSESESNLTTHPNASVSEAGDEK